MQEGYGESYRLFGDEKFGWMLYELKSGEWQKYFSFTEECYFDADYVPTMFWCEGHPESKFNKALMVSLKTPKGRISIDGSTYKEFIGATLSYIEEGLSHSRVCEYLRDRFGMSTVTEWEA